VNSARLALIGILGTAAVAGVGMYYLQVYGFYEEASGEAAGPVLLSCPTAPPSRSPSPTSGPSSATPPPSATAPASRATPPRRRAGQPYADATPRTAPGWFDCFDAAAIGAALESGEAQALLSVKDLRYGIDRVIAVLPDGRGYAWHEINACGEVVFDGDPPPPGCPPLPESD
jgi:hypothetical protein